MISYVIGIEEFASESLKLKKHGTDEGSTCVYVFISNNKQKRLFPRVHQYHVSLISMILILNK